MVFTIFSTNTFDKNERSIFGLRFYTIRDDAMSASELNADMDVHLNAGDIVVVEEKDDYAALEPGTVIVFLSDSSDTYGETITRAIRSAEYDKSGNLIGYVTFGTNTDTDDEALVEPVFIFGVYAGKIPALGALFGY